MYLFSFEKYKILVFFVYASNPHISDENSPQKWNFSKMVAIELELVTSLFRKVMFSGVHLRT